MQCGIIASRSIQTQRERDDNTHHQYNYEAQNRPKDESSNEEQVISVRITSSVAIGRQRPRTFKKSNDNNIREILTTPEIESYETTSSANNVETVMTEIPPNLVGANIEFIRQLNSKKEGRSHLHIDQLHPLQLHANSQNYNKTDTTLDGFSKSGTKLEQVHSENNVKTDSQVLSSYNSAPHEYNRHDDSLAESSIKTVLGIENKSYDYENGDGLPLAKSMLPLQLHNQVTKIEEGKPNFLNIPQYRTIVPYNDTEDAVAASSVQSVSTIANKNENDENVENIPLARSIPFSPSSKNYIQGLTNKPPSERGNNPSLTTVSFNIVHDTPKQPADYNEQSKSYTNIDQGLDSPIKFQEPSKVYSQPAQIYSEPAKFYSEPAKIYSEPAKVYSEPAKIYSEPAKIYSEPAKFYSPPASLHLTPEIVPNYTPWLDPTQHDDVASTIITTTPTTINTLAPGLLDSNTQSDIVQHPEKNYEVDEKVSVLTDGRSHGVQETSTEKCKQDNCKVGYVVEGRQYKKYRVEERTPDGFIVGEYGVVRNEDGALRGVRYTADSDASPRLIYDALMKFLQLK